MRKKIPLMGLLLACVLLTGAGCKNATTDTTNTNVSNGSDSTATTNDVITILEPSANATIESPFPIRVKSTEVDQKLYFRIRDSKGKELISAEGQPNSSTGEYYAPYMMFFGGEGEKGTLEAFHKDGTKETDLVSIPVQLK